MAGYAPLFEDRADAGRRLAPRLAELGLDDPIIYALPRGGVPVAVEIAQALEAPLDLLLVRKIGAPGAPELALAAIVDGHEPETVVNEEVDRQTGAGQAYLEAVRAQELKEIERRRRIYLNGRTRQDPKGHAVVVVDDGLATGATARAAVRALKQEGASKVVVAVPVAPLDTLEKMRGEADAVICLHPAKRFWGVGAFYDDFHQLDDRETVEILERVWDGVEPEFEERMVRVPPLNLVGDLRIPPRACGIVLFAHGSGSSRLSPRNRAVAESLNRRGLATLLLDLLTETEAGERRNVFDIGLLSERLSHTVAWIDLQPQLAHLPLGLFGASTGAAAALVTAGQLGDRVAAVVSRGGRPDLAGEAALAKVEAPTLLIVGCADHEVVELNQAALVALGHEKALEIIPKAGHRFEQPGALEEVARLAGNWFETQMDRMGAHGAPRPAITAPAPALALGPADRLGLAAKPLPEIDDAEFASAFDRFADSRVVLLGESSHGTSEFYRARAAVTRRLIEKHGFNLVTVEADWPDAAAVDRYVRLKPHRSLEEVPFSRFPTWMWRNREFESFVTWMRSWNAERAPEERAAFYGLDLYNMRAAMAAVLDYLDEVDPQTAAAARESYACLAPWSAEPAAYGRASLMEGYALCEDAVMSILREIVEKGLEYAAEDGELFFEATQNARLVANAERYYRIMFYGSDASWNLRDRHMFQTLEHALDLRGSASKAVVWAHNSHIGDARFTDMGAARGELNIGQLCRERFGREAALIGFGTHSGTVMAASNWDEPGEVMTVRPSREDSYEALCHETEVSRFLIDLRAGEHEPVRRVLREPRLERYIGVIYRPETELLSHYSQASLPDQYDAFVWFDETRAVTPLPVGNIEPHEDETYPFGL